MNTHEQIGMCGGRQKYCWPFVFRVNIPVKYQCASLNILFQRLTHKFMNVHEQIGMRGGSKKKLLAISIKAKYSCKVFYFID